MIVQVRLDSKAHINNLKGEPGIIVLLPITRTSSNSKANWIKILKIIESSDVAALVIIDKTPNNEAALFFNKSFSFESVDLYIINRPTSEPIYDSQAYVKIDDSFWILQLHDDDTWGGSLTLPHDSTGLHLFSTNFYFAGKFSTECVTWENSPPARINFTLIPGTIWNRFTEFIDAQEGHVAGSVDSALNLVSRLICEESTIKSFHYVYDNRHWENKISASKNLSVLALQDGWSEFAGPDIQILNRNIDYLAALIFFQDLIPNEAFAIAESKLFLNFRPSIKKRILVYAHSLSLIPINAMLKGILSIYPLGSLVKLQNRILKLIDLNQTKQRSWKIKSRNDICALGNAWLTSGRFPLINARFRFWEKIFSSR